MIENKIHFVGNLNGERVSGSVEEWKTDRFDYTFKVFFFESRVQKEHFDNIESEIDVYEVDGRFVKQNIVKVYIGDGLQTAISFDATKRYELQS